MLSLFTAVMAQEYITVPSAALGFKPPEITDIISFLIRFLFVIGGLIALIYLLLGGLSWITSSGEKDAVEKAQKKIQAAVIGLIVIFAVLAIVVMIERIVLPDQKDSAGNTIKCGLGISEQICLPKLFNQQ